MRRRLQMILLPVLCVLLLGCSKVTVENYAKIKSGMEYGEVVKILGKPDSSSDAVIIKNCVWGNENRNITVNFIGDKVMLTTSKNLR
jgi:hypothetical protein